MSTTVVVSSAEPTLFLCSKPNKSSTKQVHETISFTSQLTKSRIISIKNQPGSSTARTTTRIHAMYAAPAAEAETLYELLGIAESVSSVSDIKKAYKKMARKYHPDVSPPDRVDEYTRRFIMMHEAYETLSDPRSRASYDRDLAAGFGFSFSATKSRQVLIINHLFN